MHREHRHGVASGVHREEQCVLVVVGQRAWDARWSTTEPVEHAAVAAGRVGAGLGQRAVVGRSIGDHGVARRVVGLHEHDVIGAARSAEIVTRSRLTIGCGRGPASRTR